jgi:hypothetical protein
MEGGAQMSHRIRNVSFALILAFVHHQALAMDTQQLLTDLATKMKEARSLPTGAKRLFSCPLELERLAGTPLATINAVLPKADLSLDDSQSYFLTGLKPLGQRGGGFPEITLFFDEAGKVERITCNFSR